MGDESESARKIGRYHARRVLGTGGFATVWLGYDESLDAEVAIKVLAENWSRDADVRRRFLQEARVLWRLESDRIVRVYTVEEPAGGQPYFVMEYADGGNLEGRMESRLAARRPYSVDEALAISIAVAEGLVAAHARGIVHRDLKPGNVLFKSSERGERTLLADFGLARSLEEVGATTIAAGTPHYMAPEQSEGRVSAASDVYSAAVILYELLAGAVPFPYPSIGQVLLAKLTQDSPDVRSLRGDVPASLAAALARGLQRDPARRQSTAQEWMDMLTGATEARELAHGATVMPSPGPVPGATLGPEDLVSSTGATPVTGAPAAQGGPPWPPGPPAGPPPGFPPPLPGPPGFHPPPAPPAGPPSGPPPGPPPGPPVGPPSGPPAGPPSGPPAGPPPGPPAGPPPGGPVGPSAGSRRKRRQRLIAAGAALVLIAAVVVISLASTGTSQAQVFRTPVGDPGAKPFSPPTIHTATTGASSSSSSPPTTGGPSALSSFLRVAASALAAPPGAPANSQPSFSGATPGLYGGTRQLTVCDAKQLVDFLAANPAKALAWATVEGINVSDIPSYVADLTDVILRTDTQVINHGYVNGRATSIPEVLQAGTAVLIDKYGVPRARCYCGNPLLPPVPLKGTVTYAGPTWQAFEPSQVTVIQQTSVITNIVIVDVNTGVPFLRPVGTDGSSDTDAPPDALANSPFNPAASGGTSSSTTAPETTTVPETTTAAPTTTVPPTTAPAPAVNVASHGSASASSDTGGLYPASLAIDGDPSSSWFSSGRNADGPVTTYTWTGSQDFHIASIAVIGNEANRIVAFRQGFGYANSEIQVFDSGGNLTFDQTFVGPGPVSPDVHATVNATGRVVKVLLKGGQSPNCGGFAELQILGS